MRYSKILIPTLKESPADAEVISHQLMVRAGMIRKLAAGIYSILPLGLRTLKKVEQIIREEMNRIDGQEVFLPSIQPAELWNESGRWKLYGKELLRFKDRHGRDFCYGPTHEEVITDIIRKDVKSYRQLPLLMYQIQTKFRDEVRPRFGVMRGREFMMKDAYSFHADQASAQETYEKMMQAYKNVFRRCGLVSKMVEADSGTIGGSHSHEFVVVADSGEDAVGFCDSCDYASNLEKAKTRPPEPSTAPENIEPLAEVATPGKKSVAKVAEFLSLPPEKIVKTIVFESENGLVAGLVRGDRQINATKLKNLVECSELEPASEDTDVWVAYDDEALYILARLWDSQPDSIVARMGRQDADFNSDLFQVVIDAYHDKRSGYFFNINPAGAIQDGTFFNDGWDDDSWDGVWEGRTSIDEDGWTAELRIPYSQLRFNREDEYTWGILLGRVIQRKNEQDMFTYIERGSSGLVSHAATLRGIRNIQPPVRREITPY
ncbi:MAG: proline--tRNA ligase, partial [Nitrospinae bacterium]|nr:proline--tRNA ligase [Nitrospinota bacterium]